MMMWMAKLIRTCACPGPAAGCSSTRRRTPRPCSTPTTSPSSTAHWSGSRWKWLFLMKRTILPGPSLRPLTHLGDKNWPLRTFSKLRFKFKLKRQQWKNVTWDLRAVENLPSTKIIRMEGDAGGIHHVTRIWTACISWKTNSCLSTNHIFPLQFHGQRRRILINLFTGQSCVISSAPDLLNFSLI